MYYRAKVSLWGEIRRGRVNRGPTLVVLALLACEPRGAQTEVPSSAATSVISMQGIDCQSCGDEVAESLRQQTGVYAASFNRKLAELTVQYDPDKAAPPQFEAEVTEHGFVAVAGAGHGRYLEQVAFGDLDAAEPVEPGQRVTLSDHVVPNKVTVFDFYAAWCKPCREVDRHMKTVLTNQRDVALRKLDIVDWDTELAQQHLTGVEGLPYVVVFGTNGRKVAAISGLDLDRLDAAIEKGRGR